MTPETKLSLAADLVQSVQDGEKEITIRYGTRDIAEQFEMADCLCDLTSIEHVKFMDIALSDLYDDGFITFREALESMKRFYPNLTPESDMTVIRFEVNKYIGE